MTAFPVMAQRMRVEDFGRYKRPFLQKAPFTTDKRQALLDFLMVTLTLPHRTSFLVIKHPVYGQLAWKVPDGVLKKKKHYHAYLHTESLEKEFRQQKQWALISTVPEHAIVYVDTVIHPLLDGTLSLYLSLGRHACRIESPFYQTLNDTIELTDSARFEKRYVLQPFYAYLTVETDWPDARICLDGQPLGMWLELANAERKVVDLHGIELRPFPQPGQTIETLGFPNEVLADSLASDSLQVQPEQWADVHITAFDADTEIWLNREQVGQGEWRGKLAPGFYAVSSKKEGLDSRTDFFWVDAGKSVELNLISPLADYGLLNVSCDEVDAAVFLNGLAAGFAPCVLRNLPVDRTYRLRLVKGRKAAETLVRLKGNDIVNVKLKLK